MLHGHCQEPQTAAADPDPVLGDSHEGGNGCQDTEPRVIPEQTETEKGVALQMDEAGWLLLLLKVV